MDYAKQLQMLKSSALTRYREEQGIERGIKPLNNPRFTGVIRFDNKQKVSKQKKPRGTASKPKGLVTNYNNGLPTNLARFGEVHEDRR